ncbi:DUF5801 repeats-in-toxin domain-containing protein, partial [Dongia sp.]|uniref:DUF5801 repeats-in-toxin domain-containing protein n=1 Tax=Dongia sp. TaxID=1977262 RepID=UPI0035AE66F6
EIRYEDNLNFSFGVEAKDGDNDTVTAKIDIVIDDDGPKANDDKGGTYEELSSTDLGTIADFLLANDLPGADGLDSLIINNGGVGSQSGKLEIINGHVWYTAPNVQDNATETFSYTITDKDGDSSTANVTFNVTDRGGGTGAVTLINTAPNYEDDQSAPAGQAASDPSDGRLSLPFLLQVTPTDAGDMVDSVTITGIPSGASATFGALTLPVDGSGTITLVRGQNGGTYNALLDALTLGGATVNIKLAEHDDRDVTLTLNAVVDGVAITPPASASATVDAVAAQPALTDPANQSNEEATPLSTVFTVNTTATFADFGDGSEKQYILIKAPAGDWSIAGVEIAGGTASEIPGGLASHPGYLAFEVTGVADTGSGVVPVKIIVNGPGNVAGTTVGELEIISLAVDTPTDGELTTGNNSAEASQKVNLTITDRTGGEDLVTFVGEGVGGYEDDEATSQGQTDVDEPSDQHLSLTFNLKATAFDPGDAVDSVVIGGFPTGSTATWSGPGGLTLSFTVGSDNTITPTSGGAGTDASRAAFLADLIDGDGANIVVTLPEHDSRDVTITMQSTIGGTATTGDQALAIVDAVAAQPGFAGDVPGSQSLAEAGGATTSFNIQTNVAFADTADGNEKQYILVKIPGDGWSIPLVIGNGIVTFYNAASPTAIQFDGADIGHPGYIAIDVTDIAGPAAFNLVVFVNGPANVPPAGDSETIEIKAVAIDAVEGSDITPDNNQASTTQSVTLTVTDTKPTIDSVQTAIRVDEDGLSGGNAGAHDDAIGDDTTTDSKTFIGQFDYTAGKDAITGITLGTALGLTGLETLDGLAVKTIWDSATKTLTGFADADNDGQMDDGERPVFTLEVTDVAGGDYTFTLNEPLKHENSEAEGDNYEDDLSFQISVKVTDADGSESETAFVTVNIDDDTPTITKVNYSAALGDPNAPVGGDNPYPWDHSLSIGRVDEDWLYGGNEDKDGANTNGDEIGSNVVTGVVTHEVGADGLKSMGFVVGAQNADIPGLLRAYDNAQVKLHWNDSKTELVGFVGDNSGWSNDWNQVFVITLAVPSGGFTFTLKEAIEHTAAATLESDHILNFPVAIIDNDDDVATATIQIAVNDDRPVALDDNFGTETANASQTLLGNVLDDNGNGKDKSGADGFAEGGISGILSPGNTVAGDAQNGWTITIAGKGVIKIDAGGDVFFTADTSHNFGSGETFSFDYQIKDSDGDVDTATATFVIKNPAAPEITANDLYVGESKLTVSPDQPYKGSEQFSAPLTDSDTITLPAGFVVTNPGMYNIGNGFLTISQIGNQVTYSYTLTKAVDDGSPETNDGGNVVDNANNFVVNFSGPFGVTTSLTLHVDIQDDAPIAYFDSDALNNGALTTDGNVITGIGTDIGAINADRVGADGAKLTAIDAQQANIPAVVVNDITHGAGFSIQGQYGTLVIFEDGYYTYTRLNGDPFVPPVMQVSDVFDYTITDKDGDTSSTTLTIRITDQGTTLDLPVAGEDGTKVYEAGLPAGSAETADDIPNNEHSEKTSGIITVTAPDGLAGVTIGGTFISYNQLANGPLPTTLFVAGSHSGSITIDWFSGNSAGGQIGYTYALTTNTSGDDTTDSFPVVVHDLDGDQSSGNLVIDIVDDVPNAENDGNHVVVAINGDATPEISFGAATGLLSNDVLGADGASISNIAFDGNNYAPVAGFITIPVDGGTLTVNAANGAWNYNQSSAIAAPKTLTFTYTLTDGDTDFDTATFSIEPKAAEKPSFTVETVKLDEDGLASNAGDQSGNGDDDQDAGDSGEGLALPGDGRGTEAVWQQSISVNWGGDVGTLTVGFAQSSGGFVQNGNGEFLRTADGERIAWSATNGVSYESITAYAEGDNSNNPVFTIHLTETGVLTVHLYQALQHATGGQENNLTFPIWINATNVAGDEFKVVTVNIDDDVPTLAANEQNISAIVDETDLDTNDSENFSSFFTPTYGADGAGGVGNYVLGVSADGADSGLIDTATGNHIFLFLVNGQVIGKEGFDAASAEGSGATVFVVSVDNVSGEVTLDQQRAIQHPTGAHNEPAFLLTDDLITLTATVVDKDGDTTTATANIGQNLVFLDDGPTANALTSVTLDDDALTGGNPDGTGDQNPDTSGTVGSLNVDFGADGRATTGGLTGYSFTGISTTPFIPSIFQVPTGANAWVVMQGSVEIFKLEITDLATGAYKITQLNPLQHPAGLNENDITFRISLTIRDNDGDTTIADIDVTIDDDTPLAKDDDFGEKDAVLNTAVAIGNLLVDNGSGADKGGADGLATNPITNVTHATGTVAGDAASGWTITLAGKGVITIEADGDVTFTQANGATIAPTGEDFTFGYEISDKDGDKSTATATFEMDGAVLDVFVVGENVHDQNGEPTDHRIDDSPNAPDGAIDGAGGNDLLIGDVGGAETIVVPGQNYSIALICDMSLSMDGARETLLRDAVEAFVESIAGFTGNLNIGLIAFGSTAALEYQVVGLNAGNVDELVDQIQDLFAGMNGSYTNYEAAFDAANEWFVDQNEDGYSTYNKLAYFMTDGDPTVYTGGPETTGVDDIDMKRGHDAYLDLLADHPTAAVHAIGIGSGVTESRLEFFDNTNVVANNGTYGSGGNLISNAPLGDPLVIQTANELTAALQGGSSSSTPDPVGDDIVNGAGGNDVMIGDSIYYGAPDAGWEAFKAANPGKTDAELRALILADLGNFTKEGTIGGNDTMNGGAGEDRIYGQGGNDQITGGTGDDNLQGGTGNDTYHFAAGDGDDVIFEAKGAADTVVITDADGPPPAVTKDGNDLLITYNGGETIRVDDHFLNYVDGTNNQQIEFIVYNGITYALQANEPYLALTQTAQITAISDDTGAPGDFVTSDISLTVNGTNTALAPGQIVEISIDGVTWFAVNQQTGTTWNYADPSNHPTDVTYQVRVKDANGITGPVDSQLVDIDTAAPNAPTILGIDDNAGVFLGNVINGGNTDDTTPTVRVGLAGTGAVAGDKLELFDGVTSLGVFTLTAGNITDGYVDIMAGPLGSGGHSFTAQITDIAGNIGGVSGSYAIDINQTPVALDNVVNGGEATSADITFASLLANDSDPDSDPLSIVSFGNAVGGIVTKDDVNGKFVFTPNAGETEGTFEYTISDGQGGTATATVTVNFTVDTNPVANDDASQAYVTVTQVPASESWAEVSGKSWNFETAVVVTNSILPSAGGANDASWGYNGNYSSGSPSNGPTGPGGGDDFLRITDINNGNAASTQYSTPTFTIGSDGGRVTFDATLTNNGTETYTLYKWVSGAWDDVTGATNVAITNGSNTVAITSDGTYRVVFTVTDTSPSGDNSQNNRASITIDDVVVQNKVVTPASTIYTGEAISGNISSNDNSGADATHIWVQDAANVWHEITANNTVINGQYGTLVIDMNGTYDYTPNSNSGSVGQAEDFLYKLQETGDPSDFDEAHLVIGIGTQVDGDGNANTIAGTAQADKLNGNGGDDTIFYTLGDDVDGGAGTDILDLSLLGAGTFDLGSAIAGDKIDNIETIRLSSSGDQTLVLSAQDVIDVGSATFDPTDGGFRPTRDVVTIEGNAGDTLKLDDASGLWHDITSNVTGEPSGYKVYAFDSDGNTGTAGDITAYVFVSQNVVVVDSDNNVI